MTSFFGPSKFTYDGARNVYLCPQGQLLRPFRMEQKAEKVEYRADATTCNASCPQLDLVFGSVPTDSAPFSEHSFSFSPPFVKWAIGILGLMERPHFQRGLEAAVLIGVPRGIAHQPRRHFSILWSVPVCGLFPRPTRPAMTPSSVVCFSHMPRCSRLSKRTAYGGCNPFAYR